MDNYLEDTPGVKAKNIYKTIAKYSNRIHKLIEDFRNTYGVYTDGMEDKIQ